MKVSLLSSSPTRLQALHSALTDDQYNDYSLRSWAVAELGALKTPAAKAELQSYAKSLETTNYKDSTAEALKLQVAEQLGSVQTKGPDDISSPK
jgi:hypothetical protein